MAKKSTNENIVKGETSTGIKFTLDKRIKDDARLMFWLSKVQNDELEIMKRNQALFSLLELIFGSGEGLNAFLNEVAAKHNGVADVGSLMDELNDMFEALAIKN